MKCYEVQPWIRDHVDFELAETLADKIRFHCKSCDKCRGQIQSEQEFKAVIQAKVTLGKAPLGLADKVSRSIRGQTKMIRPSMINRRKSKVAAGLLMVVVLGLGIYSQSDYPEAREPMVITMKAVAEHKRRAESSIRPDMEFYCDKRSQARDWFKQQFMFNFPIPHFDERVLAIRGGRETNLVGRRVPMLFYEWSGKTLSLFVVEATPTELRQMGLVDAAHMVCAIESFVGFKIVCWKHRGFVYVLVVPGELNGIVDLIYEAYK